MTGTANALFECALSYAERGWHVFPVHYFRGGAIRCSCGKQDCSQIAKHPRTENGFKDGSTDKEIISEWWTRWPKSNIGVATGAVSGFVAIDIDTRKGGAESFVKLCAAHEPAPLTVEAVTGSGGTHLLFKHPGRAVPNNSETKLGKGLDIRGDGGYIVVAPSNHASGGCYGWKSDGGPEDIEMAELPAWLLDLIAEPIKTEPKPTVFTFQNEKGKPAKYWLHRAIAKSVSEARNDTGMWLACQLRDNGTSESDAISVLEDYVAQVPGGDHPYTDKEAKASVRSAYSRAPRSPVESLKSSSIRIGTKTLEDVQAVAGDGAMAELRRFYNGVYSGEIYNAPMPWADLTRLTQALLPSSIMMLCGDPGVGKTFWVLQALLFWFANDINASVFFIEKDRLFHTRRLLAQLEGNGKFIDLDWAKSNQLAIDNAMDRHGELIESMSKNIYSRKGGRIKLSDLLEWMEGTCKSGHRILVIDPITAAHAGAERWIADDDFVNGAADIVTRYSASLVLVTHPKKGNRQTGPTKDDMSGGAAFQRFVDTCVWLHRPPKPKRVHVRTTHGNCDVEGEIFAQLHKTRDGTGGGLQLAMNFAGNGLRFKELGIVERDAKEEDE